MEHQSDTLVASSVDAILDSLRDADTFCKGVDKEAIEHALARALVPLAAQEQTGTAKAIVTLEGKAYSIKLANILSTPPLVADSITNAAITFFALKAVAGNTLLSLCLILRLILLTGRSMVKTLTRGGETVAVAMATIGDGYNWLSVQEIVQRCNEIAGESPAVSRLSSSQVLECLLRELKPIGAVAQRHDLWRLLEYVYAPRVGV